MGAILTSVEVAERLRVSRGFVYMLQDSGKLPYFRVGNRRRVHQSDLDAYLASVTVGTRP